jgi:hypothetical protein
LQSPIMSLQEPSRINVEGREIRDDSNEGIPREFSDAMLDIASKYEDRAGESTTFVPEE